MPGMAAGSREEEEQWLGYLFGTSEAEEPKGPRPIEVRDDDDEDLERLEIASSADAASLLAAVKQRLDDYGQPAQYHAFLRAVSKESVDRQAALAILGGHSDLVAAFRRCFDTQQEMLRREPREDLHRNSAALAAQLVQLVFTNSLKAGHEFEESKMLEYVQRRAAVAAFPRRLVVLRGPPGMGRSEWALKNLRSEELLTPGLNEAEELAVRLTHVCATDDFFMQFAGKSGSERRYAHNPHQLAANHVLNEARVQLAMGLGIDPLFVDNPNMRLLDMQPYATLADRMGYLLTVISPETIEKRWNRVDFLAENNAAGLGKIALETLLSTFQPLPDTALADPRQPLRAARPAPEEEGRGGFAALESSTRLPPSAMLYKLEKLLREGTNVLYYVPPDGKGWGVSGEHCGEWHSFREKGDGSCSYSDRLQWWTDEPEGNWRLSELAALADLKREVESLPRAQLPSAATHPGLFAKAAATEPPEPRGWKARGQRVPIAPMKKELVAPPATPSQAVSTSRLERMRARQQAERRRELSKPEVFEEPPAKRLKGEDEAGGDLDASHASASSFLAVVKQRLQEWGKPEQYLEFVEAMSGCVDVRAAARILRGHDDLLQVFRRKFAPQIELAALTAEVNMEDGIIPHPPGWKPSIAVKQEPPDAVPVAHAKQPHGRPHPGLLKVKTESGLLTSAPFRAHAVKTEPGLLVGPSVKVAPAIVKAELWKKAKAEEVPRPPKHAPGERRPDATVGDEDLQVRVSVEGALRKGAEECIAELAKLLFRRAPNAAVAARLNMVRYATRMAAKPHFPREVVILRGPPGIGKTQFAMQLLADAHCPDPDEELSARLTHVCAADDFFEEFRGEESRYRYEPDQLEAAHAWNVKRARLAMEAGLHPLYVDCVNVHLWEMRPYVELAEQLGYVPMIMDPGEVCDRWDHIEFLLGINDTEERRRRGKVVGRALLTAMVKGLEAADVPDPVQAVKDSVGEAGPRRVEVAAKPKPSRWPFGAD